LAAEGYGPISAMSAFLYIFFSVCPAYKADLFKKLQKAKISINVTETLFRKKLFLKASLLNPKIVNRLTVLLILILNSMSRVED